MADTLIKVDLTQPAPSNPLVHNRWHPDIPMACWVKPGDDFILATCDWTGGAIKNDDDASDVRDVDLSTVHYLSGPVGVKGAEPGDLLVVDLLDIGAKAERGEISVSDAYRVNSTLTQYIGDVAEGDAGEW